MPCMATSRSTISASASGVRLVERRHLAAGGAAREVAQRQTLAPRQAGSRAACVGHAPACARASSPSRAREIARTGGRRSWRRPCWRAAGRRSPRRARANRLREALSCMANGPDLVDDRAQRRIGRPCRWATAFCRLEAELAIRRCRPANNGPALTAAAPSISRMRRLVATPPLAEKPPILPSAPSTRWQGMMMAIGIAADRLADLARIRAARRGAWRSRHRSWSGRAGWCARPRRPAMEIGRRLEVERHVAEIDRLALQQRQHAIDGALHGGRRRAAPRSRGQRRRMRARVRSAVASGSCRPGRCRSRRCRRCRSAFRTGRSCAQWRRGTWRRYRPPNRSSRQVGGLCRPAQARQLAVDQDAIGAAAAQQLVGRAVLHDAAAIEHHDAVEAAQGRQPVGDGDHRAARISRSSAWRIASSDSLSSEDVASSSSRSGASFRKARAMAMRWRWPPDSRAPRSPTTVEKPSGSASMKSRQRAASAACHDLARRSPRAGRSGCSPGSSGGTARCPAARRRWRGAGCPG